MSKKNYQHIHRYKKVGKLYRCIVEGCVHLIHPDLMENRYAACPYCGEKFLITKEHLRRKLLHCMNCKLKPATPAEQLNLDLFNKVIEEPVKTILKSKMEKVFEDACNLNLPASTRKKD